MTAGGRREAEMATPTPPAWLPPRTARATPTPLGTAMKTPTTRQLQPVLPSISVVGQLGEETARRFRDLQGRSEQFISGEISHLLSFKTNKQPNRNPTSTQIARAYSSLFRPIRMSFLFLMARPKTMARMGPIRGEINILATSWTGEFSTRPENFVEKTNIYFNDKYP